MPGFGIALAGTTLVGQSIGAGDRSWARRVGTYVILLAACYMGGAGVLIALGGPWLLPVFVSTQDVQAVPIVALGTRILWLAAAYQFFDGLNFGSALVCVPAGGSRAHVRAGAGLVWIFAATRLGCAGRLERHGPVRAPPRHHPVLALALSGVAGDSDLTRASALIIGGRNVLHIAHAIVDTLYFDARHIATG